MNSLRLAWQSFRFYWKNHLGLLMGALLASAILSGSMVVGDSVRASLRMAAEQRLGKVGFSMGGGDRWFTQELVKSIQAAPAIVLRGSVSAGSGDRRANAVQVLGIDDSFWALSPSGKAISLAADEIGINQALATKLRVKAGDILIVRFEAPSAISRDAPLSGSTNEEITLRRKIASIIESEDFGNFNLAAAQVAPENVFIPLGELQTAVEKEGRVNTLFAASGVTVEDLSAKLQQKAGLDDYALQLKEAQGSQKAWEVITDRVFLDESIAGKLLAQLPESHGVLTYLVNGLSSSKSENRTPYSMVTSTTADIMGKVENDSAVITQWLADDLNLTVGDEFTLRYFTVGLGRGLKEESATFKVSSILAMDDPHVNQSWTPNFPGVSDVDNCRDWTPGIPVKLDAIRDKDEEYWDTYRGTPKAFISLAQGQELWQNRFGNLTSVRFPNSGQLVDQLKADIAAHLKLTDIGLVPQDVGNAASAAAKGSVDFGGLFIGLSMFLIAAALVFAGLLFLFTLERRVSQMGLLLAVGWTPKMVRRAVLGEAALVALVGSVLGIFGGILYTKLALAGLNGIWADATVGLKLIYSTTPVTLTIAFVASLLASAGTMWWSSRRMFKATARGLLTDTWRVESSVQLSTKPTRKRWLSWAPWMLAVMAVGLGIAGSKSSNPQAMAGMFFGAGFLLLAAGLMTIRSRLVPDQNHLATNMRQIAVRNVNRRPGRSLSVIGMMAGGIFLVIAVNAFRLGTESDVTKRDSGTGGFALIGESSLPIYEDLNAETAWDEFALDNKIMELAKVVPFRVRQGDDASCLNLNRAQTPMLTAVDPDLLAERKAFTFAKGGWQDIAAQSPENCLGHSRTAALVEKPIPAIADQATALWGLGKGVGDTLDYTDASGRVFQVQLVALLSGSVMQGKIIINEADYLKKFPDAAGYQFFLIDVAGERNEALQANMEKVRSHLTRQLEQRGVALEKTSDRLAAFNAVQNTYIGIFTVLGGLGVLLGTAGLGVLAMRNVLERRSEFGLMQALGFKNHALHSMIFTEHAALLVAGLLLGLLSASLAVWPNLTQGSAGNALPFIFIVLISVGILAFGLLACWLASRLALRGKLLDALRRE